MRITRVFALIFCCFLFLLSSKSYAEDLNYPPTNTPPFSTGAEQAPRPVPRLPLNIPGQTLTVPGQAPGIPGQNGSGLPGQPGKAGSDIRPVQNDRQLSQFERYVSVKATEITDTELQIILKFDGIKFEYSNDNLPVDQAAVPVKVLSQAREVVDAGYLVGRLDTIAKIFDMLSIKTTRVASSDIRQFGYDLFSQPPSSFAPVDEIPVGPDYILGPDDELWISVWGQVNSVDKYVIDREGKITVPQLGVIYLAGLDFAKATGLIEERFSSLYKPSAVKINVSMGRLRTIGIFVVGKVGRPGSYSVSSLSTLINALFAAGGPSKDGTMRDIQLKRNGRTIVHFDLYDFLLKGDKSKDIRLMPQDVVFVPSVGPLVGMAGNVKSPAIYELKGDTRVLGLIDEAGGTNGIAYNNRLQLLRVNRRQEQALEELNLSEIRKGAEKNFLLRDGDVVTIFPVSQIVEKNVKIAGSVKAPGTFGLRPGMTVSELVTYAGGVLRYADMNYAELTRINITPDGQKTERTVINLGMALKGDPKNDLVLRPDDYLFIRPVAQWELYRVVSIKGEVEYPGEYTVKKGETISSLIKRAGGFTDRAYLKGTVFTRESVRRLQQKSLDELVDRTEQEILSSSSSALATSLSADEAQQQKLALQGEQAFISKLQAVKAKGRVTIRLTDMKDFAGGEYDIPLEDGDNIYIPEKPNFVQVTGSVYNQTAFVYDSNEDVEGYLRKAGGETADADKSDIFILKVDGSAVSRRSSSVFGYDPVSHRWNGSFMSRTLDPGDSIIVPVETNKIAWLKNIKDLTQIIFQTAVSAGVAVALF
jgi:polysaccharide biosynthesis/export protein